MVVLGEVTRRGTGMAERRFDPLCGGLGDVLVEGARRRACREDALDRCVLERAERRGVAEREVDRVGGITLAQEQDLAGLGGPDAWRSQAHEAKELGGVIAHVGERNAELVEIDRAPALRRRVKPCGVEAQAQAARRELVARDTAEVGGIDE